MADGSVTIEVTLTKQQLEKGLKSLKGTIESNLPSASKTLSGFASSFEKIGNVASSVGKVFVGATAGIVAGLGSAISRFDTLNNYPKVLSNLGFSAEDAKKSINALSERIDGLPTSLDDAAAGVQRLVAKNSDIDKSTKYFLAMNDAIVAGNAPAEMQKTAIEQLTQAYTKGKPDMMEWRTLMMAMPGQMKQVATAMGYIDTDALYEALKKGEISMDDFMNKIVELDEKGGDGIVSFKEQAKNSCDSIGTAITNMGNRLKKGFASILEGLNEMAKNTSFGSVAGIINNFSTAIKNFLDKIGTAVKSNQAVKTFIEQIGVGLNKLSETINNLKPEQLDKIVTGIVNMAKYGPALLIAGKGFSGLSTMFNGLSSGSKVLENIAGKLGQLPSVISNSSSKLSTLKNIFGSFTGGVSEGFKMMFSNITSKMSGITGAMSTVGNYISSCFSVVTDKVGTTISSLFSNISGGISSFLLSKFPGVTLGIEKIGSSFGGLFGKIMPMLSNFAPMFMKAFNITAVIGLVVAGLGLLQGQFGEKINEIANKMITEGPTIIQNLVNGIVSALPNLIAQGSQLIQTLMNVITANLPALIQGGIQIICSLVTGLAQQLPTLIPMALNMILTLVMSLLDNIDQLVDAGINLIMGLADGLINAIPILIEKIPTIIEKLLTAIINNAPKLISAGWQLIVKLVSGIVESLPKIAEAGGRIIQTIWDKLKELPGKALQWGKDMIQGFINGIKNMIGSVGKAISGIAEKVKNFLHFSKPDEGPLRDYEKWMPDMIKGLTKGIKGNSPKLYEASKKLANNIEDGMNLDEIFNKMKSTVALETAKISTNLSTTANIGKVLTANINVTGNTYLDRTKVGRMLAPPIAKTIKAGGIA